jgi:hypothetical protein
VSRTPTRDILNLDPEHRLVYDIAISEEFHRFSRESSRPITKLHEVLVVLVKKRTLRTSNVGCRNF